jgi:GNAT superfamily N-acetyltransferase
MSTPTIRTAGPGDLGSLVEFNVAMAAETEDRTLPSERVRAGIARLLDDPGLGRYLIAEAPDASIAGALAITYEWSDWRNGLFWWIQSVYVRPAWRRRGVYAALHRQVEDEARADPECCGLRLYVERDNAPAMATYRAMGMDETDYRLYESDFSG